MLKSGSTSVTQSSESQLDAREHLWEEFQNAPLDDAEKERNLGLFIRSPLLARLLAISDVYREIVQIPGSVLDFGTWRGQNAVLCENLRAIFEPFNKQRRIAAFDTFQGYKSHAVDAQVDNENFRDGCYSTGEGYADYLTRLLGLHESINALPHVPSGHKVVAGDIKETLPQFIEDNRNLLVALAFFDMNLEGPTRFALDQILGRCVPGSLLVFFQLQRDFLPGEGYAYVADVLGKVRHELRRSATYPSLCIVKIL
ncbi:dTDP-6-deoxy-L-hexose 3-O-methyltransferase [Pseudomonas sp. ZL2]